MQRGVNFPAIFCFFCGDLRRARCKKRVSLEVLKPGNEAQMSQASEAFFDELRRTTLRYLLPT